MDAEGLKQAGSGRRHTEGLREGSVGDTPTDSESLGDTPKVTSLLGPKNLSPGSSL